MSEARREKLIANVSWWAGWCTDNEGSLPELTKLSGLLLDVKGQMAEDRKEDGASVDNWTKTTPEEFLERSASMRTAAVVARQERERNGTPEPFGISEQLGERP